MEFQAEIIKSIQSVASPALDVIFQFITILAEDLVLVPVVALIYWCINKEMGYWLCWCAAMGNLVVNSVKGIFKIERPIGWDGIRTLREETATGYSFPSGHTQASANLCTAIARAVNRKRFWVLAVVFPLLVAISRLYLGVHWPMDVGAAYIIGICLPFVLWFVYRKFANHKALLFLISSLVFIPFCFMTGNIADFWKSFGFGVGLAAATYIETKFINFEVEGTFKTKALRFCIGIVLVVIVYGSMKLLLPSGNIIAFIRYFCVPFTAVAVCPAIFKKLHL